MQKRRVVVVFCWVVVSGCAVDSITEAEEGTIIVESPPLYEPPERAVGEAIGSNSPSPPSQQSDETLREVLVAATSVAVAAPPLSASGAPRVLQRIRGAAPTPVQLVDALAQHAVPDSQRTLVIVRADGATIGLPLRDRADSSGVALEDVLEVGL